MAKLHRRIHRLSHPGLIVLAVLACASTVGAQAVPSPVVPDDAPVGRSVREIDALLGRLTDGSPTARRTAATEIINTLDRDDVPALRDRILTPLRCDLTALRIKMIRAVHTATDGRENVPYDLLTLLMGIPRAPDVDAAVERVTLARALGRIPTADAGRALVSLAGFYNGLFRQEIARIIQGQARDYVLPGLIELRNPSEGMRIFTRQVREGLRRVTPGETVQQHDNALLAEILRAYGSMHEPDAMRVVVSFVNSDRAQVRDAARWSVSEYGRESLNALREAYEMYEGHPSDVQWGWERTAQEIYQANDRRREAEVAAAMDEGLAAGRAGHDEDMVARFRYVLARHPAFERRGEMVGPLESYARRLETTDAVRAEGMYRLALWLDPSGPRARVLRGEILFLDAERALARGVADPELYQAVLRVDPANARARDQLEQVEQSGVLRARKHRREVGAVAILCLALAGLWALTRRTRWLTQATVTVG